ncbi:Spo11/DNA topoisomerase VI subunit A [Stachybotrys elegans]|uniref:DNA topoisomerase (ATP-hydrolyzing) n=1 Tax=Stachybotrys elegans TaxID=80388 RepID=A0A8K0SW41_9HYPO|nr:Spo11/DNA topoisomerase VI subunit A [Stachybotrys elegans]
MAPYNLRSATRTTPSSNAEVAVEQTAPPRVTGMVVARIENILESVLDGFSRADEVRIEFKSRKSMRRRVGTASTSQQEYILFPGRTVHEAKRFARVLLILQLSHDALVSGTVLTKRHIFYQHQDLFEKQRNVDELVDDIAFTLGVNRHDLNIAAAPKGHIIGLLKLKLLDEAVVDMSLGTLGTTIPEMSSVTDMDFGRIPIAVIIAVLAHLHVWSRVNRHGQYFRRIGTLSGQTKHDQAKGYPDMATLSFLREVHRRKPEMPILALVDFDPDGLNIFRCYRYTSEQQILQPYPTNPAVQLLGIGASQVLEEDSPTNGTGPQDDFDNNRASDNRINTKVSVSSVSCRDPFLHLTGRDRKLAVSTLQRLDDVVPEDDEATHIRRELQVMLMMGVKVEIQWLDDSGNLSDWLDKTISNVMASR